MEYILESMLKIQNHSCKKLTIGLGVVIQDILESVNPLVCTQIPFYCYCEYILLTKYTNNDSNLI